MQSWWEFNSNIILTVVLNVWVKYSKSHVRTSLLWVISAPKGYTITQIIKVWCPSYFSGLSQHPRVIPLPKANNWYRKSRNFSQDLRPWGKSSLKFKSFSRANHCPCQDRVQELQHLLKPRLQVLGPWKRNEKTSSFIVRLSVYSLSSGFDL